MSYDGTVVCAMVQELRSKLLLGKIEKIYQPQPEQLLFVIHTNRGKRRLFISASGSHSAAYLVEKSPENPSSPPVFCMVLRKHLGAARITDILQHENDRVMEIIFETIDDMGFNVNRKLIIEIMGKHSNILLVDIVSGKIIDSIKHVGIDVNRTRQILPRKIYEYPPAQNKKPFLEVTEDDITSIMVNQMQAERSFLDNIQGISPALAQTMAAAEDPYTWLTRLRTSIIDGAFAPIVYVNDGIPVDFHITPLAPYEDDDNYEALCFDTLSQAAAYYFTNREVSNTLKQKSNDLLRVIKSQTDKLNLKMQRLSEDLSRAQNSDKFRLYGELLTANLHLVKQGADKVTVLSFYDGTEITIPLDPKYSPSRNAQNYYKKYGKAKTAVREKQHQLDETSAEIKYLESVSSFIERASSIEDLELIRNELIGSGYLRDRRRSRKNSSNKKKISYEPHTYTLPSGKRVMAGRNNNENDWLTFKKASSKDIWFHTKDIPGSHVILFTDGKEATENDLFQAASIAAFHSKGVSSENVPVDFTKVKFVKKPVGSRPGYVIFTHNRTLYVKPEVPR